MSEYIVIGTIIAAFAVAAVLSYFFTPPVKNFAHKVGAIDVPKDARRMHKKPIPRLGGLAIYGGFLCSILIFGQLDETMLCVLLGAAIIVALGIFDDVLALGAKLKFVVQIVAAAIPVCIGDLQIGLFTNLNPLSDTPFVHLGILAVPVTIIWIVGITNAVNLIDGLDGLAVGVSSIAAITMLAVALLTGNMPIGHHDGGARPARASALCRTTSIRLRSSWATPARPSSATCWRPCPSWVCSNSTQSSRLRCRS